MGPSGAIRNPLALFAKLMISIDDNKIKDTRLSYLTEFSIGHQLGDSLWNLLPPHLHKYQSACFDYFCRHSPKHEKLILSSDPVPDHVLEQITKSTKWLSKTAFYSLPSKIRQKIVQRRQLPSYPENPDVSLLESELLHTFQL